MNIKQVIAPTLVSFAFFNLAFPLKAAEETPAVDVFTAMLMDNAIDSPADLQAHYRSIQSFLLPILPLDPNIQVIQRGGLIVVDPKEFDSWLQSSPTETWRGVAVHPIFVRENSTNRHTILYNNLDEVIDSLPPEAGYNPFALLAALWPELYAFGADAEERAEAEALTIPPASPCRFGCSPRTMFPTSRKPNRRQRSHSRLSLYLPKVSCCWTTSSKTLPIC